MRATCQWRDMKVWKWHGFGHDTNLPPGEMALALFCAACPQPGVNLPEDWQSDPDQ